MTGPSSIVNLPPADPGTSVRRPRVEVWVEGQKVIAWFEMTMVRGLDQDMATLEFIVPHPMPDFMAKWGRVQLVAGIDPKDTSIPQNGTTVRFTGYIVNFSYSMWPPGVVVRCEDILTIAAHKYTPEEMDLHSMTDQFAVREVLFGCGYHESTFSTINGATPGSGTGTVLADIEEAQLWWELGQTGLERIKSIDEVSLGWRTYATAGGNIVRREIVVDPNKVGHIHHFSEGVDVLEGSVELEEEDPKNEITVEGFDGTTQATLDPDDDPFHWSRNSYWKRYTFLRTQATSIGIINPEQVAQYILSQIGMKIVRVTFTTHLDIHLQGQEVFKLTSRRLEVDQKFWTQSVQLTAQSSGEWAYTITGVSKWQIPNRHMVVPPIEIPDTVVDISPGVPVLAPPLPTPAPIQIDDFLVDFTIEAVDKEMIGDPLDEEDTGSNQYIVTCTESSSNVQLLEYTRTWTADGPGVTITEKVDSELSGTFVTSFTDLEGASITLTLEADGVEASMTKEVDPTIPVRSRKLYAYTEDTYEAFDGTQWRSQPPVAGTVVGCVGAGPLWGMDHYVATSTDDLATPPTEVVALPPGEAVISLWLHEVNGQLIAAGGENGSVAISSDGGASWVQKTPLPSAVRQIIISIFLESELHVVTEGGWYTSNDQGESWDVVRAGDFVYLELSHTRNIVVTAAGELEKAEDGIPFNRTSETSPIKAATAHIRADTFYAIAEDGTTWVQDTPGSYDMVAGEPIPAGSILPGGAYRDGQMVDVVFYAAQDGGIFKTIDGFRSPEGYGRIRHPDRLGP